MAYQPTDSRTRKLVKRTVGAQQRGLTDRAHRIARIIEIANAIQSKMAEADQNAPGLETTVPVNQIIPPETEVVPRKKTDMGPGLAYGEMDEEPTEVYGGSRRSRGQYLQSPGLQMIEEPEEPNVPMRELPGGIRGTGQDRLQTGLEDRTVLEDDPTKKRFRFEGAEEHAEIEPMSEMGKMAADLSSQEAKESFTGMAKDAATKGLISGIVTKSPKVAIDTALGPNPMAIGRAIDAIMGGGFKSAALEEPAQNAIDEMRTTNPDIDYETMQNAVGAMSDLYDELEPQDLADLTPEEKAMFDLVQQAKNIPGTLTGQMGKSELS